jgi:catechol 2,3-dioxygenase-like lactoylglutathione lyase family enzyme
MFACVTVTASDLAVSRRFYETVLATLPGEPWDAFALEAGDPTRDLHLAFAAPAREDVDAFWRAGVEAGYTSDGEPGSRPQYTPDYYGGFLLDPDGNSVEAVHRPGRTETGPRIDHLWLGVADLAASRAYWEQISPQFGLEVGEGRWPGYVFVSRDRRHLALIDDGRPPAQNVRIAIAGPDGDVVEVL